MEAEEEQEGEEQQQQSAAAGPAAAPEAAPAAAAAAGEKGTGCGSSRLKENTCPQGRAAARFLLLEAPASEKLK